MLSDELAYQIKQELGLTPTNEQASAISVFTRFLTDRETEQSAFMRGTAMILRGSAGTGKTTLASAMVRTLVRLRQKVVLLAPTGRAAKVFSLNAGMQAFTIHRRIYRQRSLEGGFNLNYNTAQDTLFFVDESSMISTETRFAPSLLGNQSQQPSSGLDLHSSLLDDLVSYVYAGRNCRLILIGDKAQLPPVGEQDSPALSADVLRSYNLSVYECDLNEVLRQSQDSGILWNATRIRGIGSEDETRNASQGLANGNRGFKISLPLIRFQGFADITRVPGDELIESLASSYSHVGVDETMVVTRSNKRANVYNLGIRNTILGREEELTTGDRLMVVKNKYLPQPVPANPDSSQSGPARQSSLDFIANGDMAVVQRVRNIRDLYGFRFADVTIQLPDYEYEELSSTVILDTLQAEAPALTREQQQQLFQSIMDDYADLPTKQERLKRLKEDAYYNALQVKYGYAVTCHKAQGGQWAHVYIDQGYMTDDMLTPDYIHWLYTAFTRATEHLFLVNWPRTQIEECHAGSETAP